MSEDLKGIRVNGTLWEVADVDARKALETKLTIPAGGTQGQVLTRTADGYAWQTVEGSTESVTYTAGTGIEITEDNVINCTVTPESGTTYTAGTGIEITNENVINCTVTPGDAVTYTAGTGIEITEDNVVAIDFEIVAKKEDIKVYTAGGGIAITPEGMIRCTIPSNIAGSCIDITENVVSLRIADERGFNVLNTGLSLNFEVIATQNDVFAVDQKVNGLQETVTDIGNSLGDINIILDAINGEEI